MEKNDVFTFTAPNGEEVTAVVIKAEVAIVPIKIDSCWTERVMLYICYAQNRLFTMTAKIKGELFINNIGIPEYGEVIADYAILPKYDVILENYQHQIDMANDYADKTL
jgi:hypothetical protein